jgi:hypothetical protein
MASNNYIYKMSNAGGFKSLTRYYDMLAGNTVWNPWEPAGAYDALASVTLSADTATVSFVGIPSGYKHLQIRCIFRSSTGGGADNVAFQFNGDSSASYATHALIGNGTSASAAAFTGNTFMYLPSASPDALDTSGMFGAGIIDILDYTNTNKNTTVRALSGYDDNGSGGYRRVVLSSSLWLNTAAVTSITFSNSANLAAATSFALFGVN